MYARVYHAFGDTTAGAQDQALLDLSQSIAEQGVPLIWINAEGVPAGTRICRSTSDPTLPDDDPRVRAYVAVLAAQHPPIVDSLIGKIYYGDSPVVRVAEHHSGAAGDLRRGRPARRLLRHSHARRRGARATLGRHGARVGASTRNAALESVRLDRAARGARDRRHVAARRSPTCAAISSGSIASRTASSASDASRSSSRSTSPRSSSASTKYFQARVPTLANTIAVRVGDRAAPRRSFTAIRVLLEWAVEVLTKNAIDALAGRGGTRAAVGAAGSGRFASSSASPTTDRAFRASCAIASSSPASPRRRAAGASASRSRNASSKRITAANSCSRRTTQGATFEIILH